MATTMATTMARSGGRLDKRRAILDAAGEVFGELGYERASVDAIARRAGVSKPTIYHHFGTKEQLFRDSIAESAARINEETMQAIASLDVRQNAWRAGLHELAVELVRCHLSECAQSLQRQMYAEIKRDPGLFSAVNARAGEPIVRALAGQLAILANAGHLRVADPRLAARQYIALTSAELVELTELGARTPTAREVRRAASAGVDTFLAAYAVTTAARRRPV